MRVRLHRISATPENDLLPKIRTPTLVLHSRGDERVAFEHGLAMARTIADSRPIALESRNHLILSHEPAWQHYGNALCRFLDDAGALSAFPAVVSPRAHDAKS